MLDTLNYLRKKIRFWLINRALKTKISINKRLIILKEKRKFYHHQEGMYGPNFTIDSTDGFKTVNIYYKNKKFLTTKNINDLKIPFDEMLIIGAGPSLRDMDLSSESGENFILVNSAVLLAEKFPKKPFMCVVVDHFFILRDFRIFKKIPKGTNLLMPLHCITLAYEKNKKILSDYNVYLAPIISYLYNTPAIEVKDYDTSKVIVNENKTAGFTLDFDYGFHVGGTVITVALQVVYWLNVKRTYILGMDLQHYDKPYFYEKGTMGHTRRSIISRYDKVLPFMQLTRKVFDKQGLELYNCSPTTLLPYDIIPYSDKFLKK